MLEKLQHYLESTEAEQFDLLEKLILQSSHTLDKEGVDSVGQIIRHALSDCDIKVEVDKVSDRGNNLIFRSLACENYHPQILLVGHMDTVFPDDSPFNTFTTDSTKAYGPGVIDMKGGLVTAIYLLKGLHSQNLLSDIPITFVCNSDEEMGSTKSTVLICEEAKKSFCAFVFECGGLNNEVVTGRKGKNGYRLEVFGQAGHAAFAGSSSKASAILELAHKTIALENINDAEKQIVVNVGIVEGGVAANVVAEKASVEIDTRFISAADGHFCHEKIREIASHCTIPGTTCSLTPTHSRPPMEQSQANHALYELVAKQADKLSLKLIAELRSGVSDANTLAECGVPVLDGLGPVGSLDHSENEYMINNTLVQRCKLATLSVIDIWEKQSKGELTL